MKSLIISILTLCCSLSILAIEPDSMYVHFTGQYGDSIIVLPIDNIDSITFYAPPAKKPKVVTLQAASITSSTVTLGGEVTNNGNATITSRGIEYSSTQNFTLGEGTTVNAITTGTGNYTIHIEGLSSETTYYYRAFATNSEGTSYSDSEFSFITNESITLPTVTTEKATSIASTTVMLGGKILDNGNATIVTKGFEYSTVENFPLGDGTSIETSSSGIGAFTVYITGLTPETTYYFRAFAINSEGIKYGNNELNFITTALPFSDFENMIEGQAVSNALTDADGNYYSAVKIGSQIWMAENLRTTKYPDGKSIPKINDEAAWGNLGDNDTDDAYCWHSNDSANAPIYGALYSFAAAINSGTPLTLTSQQTAPPVQGICPTGWHLPSDAEWTVLEISLEPSEKGSQLAGNESLWYPSDGDLERSEKFGSSGFSCLPGGYRDYDGIFGGKNTLGRWWSSTQPSDSKAWYRYLYYNNSDFYRLTFNKSFGFSVRCIKD